MRDILAEVQQWLDEGLAVATATVVSAWGSAPRPPGARLAVSERGQIAGSVSGGCVEGAVVEEALRVLAGGAPQLLRFGIADETAWAVGLSCGGTLEIWVEQVGRAGIRSDGQLGELCRCLAEDRLVQLVTALSGPEAGSHALLFPDGRRLGALGEGSLGPLIASAAEEGFSTFACRRLDLETDGQHHELFFEVHPPRPRLVVVGAVHVAVHLVHFAQRLGFTVIVVDPRTAFATEERFGHADQLLTDWPDAALESLGLGPATYVVTLTHDPKLDLPALRVALRSPARYVGALGSKRTHAKRLEALRGDGFSTAELERIHAPIGLDIGARRAEEIALAVIAEIIAASHGRDLRRPEDRAPAG